MTATASLLAALGLLAWPDGRVPARLHRLTNAGNTRSRPTWPWPPRLPLILLTAATAGLLTMGAGGAIAAAVLAATAHRLLKSRDAHRATTAAVEGLAEALRSFADALRAGAHPVPAAESAAAEAHPAAAAVLTAIATAARLGGDVAPALAATAANLPALAPHLPDLAKAVRMANRHGLPLADVMDASRRDLHLRARHAKTVQARMAGPRTTATILAALPVIGIALGESTGASPLHVLAHTGLGQAMLVVGALLISAGLTWTARLTTHTASPTNTNQRPAPP